MCTANNIDKSVQIKTMEEEHLYGIFHRFAKSFTFPQYFSRNCNGFHERKYFGKKF